MKFSTRLCLGLLALPLLASFVRAQVVLDDFSSNQFATSYAQKSGATSWNVVGGQAQPETANSYSAFAWTEATLTNVGDSFSIDLMVQAVLPGQNGGLAVWASSTAYTNPAIDRLFEPRLSYTGNGYEFTSEFNNQDGYLISALSGTPGFSPTLTVSVTDRTASSTTLTATLSGPGFDQLSHAYTFDFTNPLYVGPSAWQATGGSTYFDNFTYTTSAVPEPSTYAAIAGAAALGFAAWRRRGRTLKSAGTTR
ncbi:PEP-CTERM sorting domain-containing protein [Opitutus terrae]|uniref:Ice-binding protein C-terminal domain-containing protein n=1 Tax=Opitutus terrae (strain DSM 11246 / JCM 15787 / PB90-1) TaxID=452637 RepID=B1ZVR3_OPITP|nr:PEP-CTERM sorting domain-containing protein [Opitutus terrae]ACB74999.1 protein of unknown function DUF1555 [Opitutus terrae PB90-1]